MIRHNRHRHFACQLFITLSLLSAPLAAKNLFSPAIRVNDQVITVYELEQRKKLLQILNATGDVKKLARQQLIEDRLKIAAANDFGLRANQEDLENAIDRFVARGGLDSESFIAELERLGVSRETFHDFIMAGVSWQMFVQSKFGQKSRVTESEVERSLNTATQDGGLQVLLTEIILPAPSGQQEEAQEIAKALTKITSFAEFSDAAREYSAAPSRSVGGRVKWQDLDELPPVLKPLILGLAVGEVTEPLPIPNGLAIFQLRAIAEKPFSRPKVNAVDFAQYSFTSPNPSFDQEITKRIDYCDDLFGLAKIYPDHKMIRQSLPLKDIPAVTRSLLEKLDANELVLTRENGISTLTMVCTRVQNIAETSEDIEQLRRGLRNKRLETYARGYLDNLLQDARIIDK